MRRVLFCLALVAAFPPAAAQAPRISFEQPAGGIAYIEATYENPAGETCPTKLRRPLRSRLRGRIEVVQTANQRLSIINTLSFSEYLQGLAEVPRSWPQAALEAQVIAARSYAMYHRAHPRGAATALGYDICATDACQVYRGASVEQGAFGDRWIAAVRDTLGKVLTVNGEPVQAFYHSTSSGRTKPHFDNGSPQPYLAPVSGEDADSPLSRWSVHIPFGDLSTILVRGGQWPGGPIGRVTAGGGNVVVSNAQRRVSMTAARFRRVLNVEAPCAFAGKYPPVRADGGRLPSVVPQARYTLAAEPGGIAVFGRGWGHDVGMSQYGARSLAARGRSAAEILAHFYNGVRPSTVDEPSAIRVLVAEGATGVIIDPEGTGTLSGATPAGKGPAYAITPGANAPAVTRRPPPAPVALQIEDRGIKVESGRMQQTISLPVPAQITVRLSGPGGNLQHAETSYDRGRHTLTVVEPGNPQLAAGRYRMEIEAYDGLDHGRMEKTIDYVPAATVAAPSALPRPAPEPSRRPLWPVVAAFGVVLIAGIGLGIRLRRSR